MLAIELILRWMHIVGAAVLVGGTIFWWFAVIPAQGAAPPEAGEQTAVALRARWSKLVMLSSGLLLLSGLINLMLLITRFDVPQSYHMLFGIKFLLSLVVFVLASLLAGRTAVAERVRKQERFWLSMNVILAISVVCLGGLLRAGERRSKNPPPSSSVAMSEAKN